jgi:hypothetical protein
MCLALGLIGGASLGAFVDVSSVPWQLALVAAVASAVTAYARGWSCVELLASTSVFACGGVLLATTARDAAVATPLRAVLDDQFGGFAPGAPGPEGTHPPVLTRGVLTEDASATGPGAQLRVGVEAVWVDGSWVAAPGNIYVSVSGSVSPETLATWRAGRSVVVPATFRRPARYLNQGVPDFEQGLALRGTTLFAAVKSGLLVDIVAPGTWRHEQAARVRAIVRRTAVGCDCVSHSHRRSDRPSR